MFAAYFSFKEDGRVVLLEAYVPIVFYGVHSKLCVFFRLESASTCTTVFCAYAK